MRFLSKIADTFRIRGRGTVIVFEPLQGDLRVKAKDGIQLRTPAGDVIDTHVVSIEHSCGPNVKPYSALLLPAEIGERNIPSGTEIWVIQNA